MQTNSITPAQKAQPAAPIFIGYDTHNRRPAAMFDGPFGKFWLPAALGNQFKRVVIDRTSRKAVRNER